jgi:surface antigen
MREVRGWKRGLATVVACAALAGGCAQNGSSSGAGDKETIGTIVGGLAGGLLGSQVGSGTGNVLAIGTGAALGALLGNYIGSQLDEADKREAAAAANKALSAPTPTTVAWNNPDTGNSGTIKTGKVVYERRGTGAPAAPPRLEPPPAALDAAEPVWRTASNANLRASPSTSGGILGRIKAGRSFQVLGSMPGSEWLVVGENGAPVGYVSRKVARPVGAAPSGTPTETAGGGGVPEPTAPSTPTPSAPATPSSTAMLVDPGAIDRSVGTKSGQEGADEVACRTTTSTVRLKGNDQPQVTTSKFCKQPDGSWAPVKA